LTNNKHPSYLYYKYQGRLSAEMALPVPLNLIWVIPAEGVCKELKVPFLPGNFSFFIPSISS
jgi:hypothetical protein